MRLPEIQPGQSIGRFYIGMTEAAVLQAIQKEKKIAKRSSHKEYKYILITTTNYRLWICKKTNKLTKMCVTGDFSGKLESEVGLGTNFGEAVKLYGQWTEDEDLCFFRSLPLIGFMPGETDDDTMYDETKAPIDMICIFSPSHGDDIPSAEGWAAWFDGLPPQPLPG